MKGKDMHQQDTVQSEILRQADELELYITNAWELYDGIIKATINNDVRHRQRGDWHEAKALKQWYRVSGEGARRYVKEIGTGNDVVQGRAWFRAFPPVVRRECAKSLQAYYEEEIQDLLSEQETGTD